MARTHSLFDLDCVVYHIEKTQQKQNTKKSMLGWLGSWGVPKGEKVILLLIVVFKYFQYSVKYFFNERMGVGV